MSRWASVCVIASLMIPGLAWSQDAQDGEAASPQARPEQVVETLHAGLLDIMKRSAELGLDGRREVIAGVVEETFDMRALAGSAIGVATWNQWNDEQKATYLETFQRFLVVNYAVQFDGFSGQSFETKAVDEGPRGTKLVKTWLVRPEKEPVELSYLIREKDGQLGIADVFAEGGSEAARRRSEFDVVYRASGFDGLISSIETRTADLLGDAPAADAG